MPATQTEIPIAAITALPTSPAEIPIDASIEMLEVVKAAWLKQAIEDGLPAALWHIASEFGQKERKYARDFRIFRWNTDAGEVCVRLTESALGWFPHCGCFYTNTWLHVTVADKTVANIIWKHPEGEPPRSEQIQLDKSIFVPGAWAKEIPRFAAQAAAIERRRHANEAEAARKQLLRTLLAGQTV